MRALVLLLVASLTVSLLAPTVAARHAGPCYHEYVDAIRGGPSRVLATVDYCVAQETGWVCHALDPCLLP